MDDRRPPEGPQRLPGVGLQLTLIDEDGEPLVATRRKDGRLELLVGGRAVVLPAPDAVALGSLAAGRMVMGPDLVERTDRLLGGLDLDWITVPPGAAVAGRSIAEVEFRRRSGTSIVAILRGSLPIVDPDPDQLLLEGDDLVIACQPADRAGIEQFVIEGR
jgi:TrkA domain protein